MHPHLGNGGLLFSPSTRLHSVFRALSAESERAVDVWNAPSAGCPSAEGGAGGGGSLE